MGTVIARYICRHILHHIASKCYLTAMVKPCDKSFIGVVVKYLVIWKTHMCSYLLFYHCCFSFHIVFLYQYDGIRPKSFHIKNGNFLGRNFLGHVSILEIVWLETFWAETFWLETLVPCCQFWKLYGWKLFGAETFFCWKLWSHVVNFGNFMTGNFLGRIHQWYIFLSQPLYWILLARRKYIGQKHEWQLMARQPKRKRNISVTTRATLIRKRSSLDMVSPSSNETYLFCFWKLLLVLRDMLESEEVPLWTC